MAETDAQKAARDVIIANGIADILLETLTGVPLQQAFVAFGIATANLTRSVPGLDLDAVIALVARSAEEQYATGVELPVDVDTTPGEAG